MSREYKHIGMKTKTQNRHLIILMALATALFASSAAYADPVTVKIRKPVGARLQYKINSGGSWSAWSTDPAELSIEPGNTLYLKASVLSGYTWNKWYGRDGNSNCYYPTQEISIPITYNTDLHISAHCTGGDLWEGDLEMGYSYQLTTESGGKFKVNVNHAGSPFENQVYSAIGDLSIEHYAPNAANVRSSNVNFANTEPIMIQGTIMLKRGRLRLKADDVFVDDLHPSFGFPHLKRKDGYKYAFVTVQPNSDIENPLLCELEVLGKSTSERIEFSGGCDDMSINTSDPHDVTISHTGVGQGTESKSALFQIYGGHVNMDYAHMTKCWYEGACGAVVVNSYSGVVNCEADVTMDGCLFDYCNSEYGCGVLVGNGDPDSKVYLTDCEVANCYTHGTGVHGGAVRSSGGAQADVKLERCELHHNYTYGRGGAVHWNAANSVNPLRFVDCTLHHNWARERGGAIYLAASAQITGSTIIRDNMAEEEGGGIQYITFQGGGPGHMDGETGDLYWFPPDGLLSFGSGCQINNNWAGQYGGGVSVATLLSVFHKDGVPIWTAFLNKDMDPYQMQFIVNGATFQGNEAGIDGGAVYLMRDTDYYGIVTDLNYGTIQSNTADSDNNATGNGGAFCVTEVLESDYTYPNLGTTFPFHGEVYDLTKESIIVNLGESGESNPLTMTGNEAVNGGALYVSNGTVNMYANTTIGGSAANANQTTTGDGGALYVDGGTTNILGGTMSYNTAGRNGGALYANGGMVNFSNGTLSNNSAAQDGGGIYIPASGTLTLTGTATLAGNHVPAAGKGGGVYLAGVVEVGTTKVTPTDVLTVATNYAGTAANLNNIYLPNPRVTSTHEDVITLKQNGLASASRIGFSVSENFVPVIYCDETSPYTYLESFLVPIASGGMKETVFDDAAKYTIVHYSNNSYYDPKYLYLSSGTWVDHVTSQPEGFSVSGSDVTISSAAGLAWLIRYVNGISPNSTPWTPQPNVNVTLTADLDMGDYGWVPIGYSQNSTVFTGTFDGQGHTISEIYCQYLGSQTGTILGLFGTIGTGASISNVQMKGAKINTSNMDSGTAQLGAIAGCATGGTIQNCVVDAELETLYSSAVMGGLVGQATAGTIHSCIATPDMKGYTMGGLVGNNAGNVFNSLANAKFTNKGSGYMGGLVAVNSGTVENCYARLQGSAPASNFGWLVGDNSGAGVKYCYIPAGESVYKANGDNPSGHGTYGETVLPVLYNHADTQVAIASGTNSNVPSGANKQLLVTLNNWVTTENTKDTPRAVCTYWLRPWQKDNSSKFINDDLPLLRMPATNAVASSNATAALDYSQVNSLLGAYTTANDAVCFYGKEASMNGNAGSSATLYIDLEAVLKQSGTGGAISAYVGVGLQNLKVSNYQWHMFSTALQSVPLGVNYTNAQEYPFSWTHPSNAGGAMPYWRFYAEGNANHGYFPSMTYAYGSTNAYNGGNADATSYGNYYYDWDYYCYSEPDYHWINFKRNSASHWHEDDGGATNIPYTNETTLGVGKGYFVSVNENTYLQAYGTLNNGSLGASTPNIYKVTVTDRITWTHREGFNLVGNPYQSYLNFNAFATENKGLWGGDQSKAYYYIIEGNAYTKYAYNASKNTKAAPPMIHPHQGFFIVADNAAAGGTALIFTDAMREVDGRDVTFRGMEQPAYPLVNLIATDDEGKSDIVTVELDRPDRGGAKVMTDMRISKGILYCHYDDEDYAIAFTRPGLTEAAIRFETAEDALFTMTWDTENGDFHYLHLIDNMTGADIDCLTTDEYSFTARATDYTSRFRLVFDYTGIEENGEDGPSTGSGAVETFAYYANGEIHLTNTCDDASLQIVDMLGRVVMQRDAINRVSTSGMASGVYILRLTTNNGSKMQKIIIEK